ncbi:hypothetical protein Tco_0357543 [Tanacetum coccineum]
MLVILGRLGFLEFMSRTEAVSPLHRHLKAPLAIWRQLVDHALTNGMNELIDIVDPDLASNLSSKRSKRHNRTAFIKLAQS